MREQQASMYEERNVSTRIEQTMIEALEPVAIDHGFELVDVELAGATRAPVLRVFLDKAGGLTLDELAAANSWVSDVVDSVDPFKGSYVLEVSSPGIDRPLRTLEHFARFIGQTAHIATTPPAGSNSRSKWTGVLAGLEDDKVLIEADGEIYRISIADIKKAHLKGAVDFSRSINDWLAGSADAGDADEADNAGDSDDFNEAEDADAIEDDEAVDGNADDLSETTTGMKGTSDVV